METEASVSFSADTVLLIKKISRRIVTAHLDGNPKVSVIADYAPTEDKNDKEKDAFYVDLETAVAFIPPNNLAMIMGDFNARIGKDRHITDPRIVCIYMYHEATNNNGMRLLDLCQNYSWETLDIGALDWVSCPTRSHPHKKQMDQFSIHLQDIVTANIKVSLRSCKSTKKQASNKIQLGTT